MAKKLLSLDLSTSTGWALFDGRWKLETFGIFIEKPKSYKAEIKTYLDYPMAYPNNFIDCATRVASQVDDLIEKHKPDAIVIEETNRGRQRFSQKLLEFIHFTTIGVLTKREIKPLYLTQKCWRDSVGAYATKEEKSWNAKVGRLKKKARAEGKVNAVGALKPVKIDGEIAMRKSTKHFSLRVVKELYGIELGIKENDQADAILLGTAAWNLGLVE